MKKNKLTIILSTLLIIYTIIGFVAIPKIVKPIIEDNINANITQTATLEKVSFNPFLFTFSLHNLKIADKSNTTFSIDSLSIDFNLIRTISEKHLAFQNLDLINPYIHIIENEDNSFNLEKLVKQTENENIKEDTSTEQSTPIKFQIYKTILEKAKIKFTKLSKDKEPFEVNIHELNYTFYDMGTFRNILASHSLDILINKHTKLTINGGLKVHPFNMYGNARLTNLHPSEFMPYKDNLFNFKLTDETSVDLNFGYKVNTKDSLSINIDNLNFDLNNLNILQNANSVVYLKNLSLEDLNLAYPQNKVSIESFNINDFNTKIIKDKKEIINLSRLINIPESKETEQSSTKKQDATMPWEVTLNNFNLTNSKFYFEDKKALLKTSAKDINIQGKNLSLIDTNINLEEIILKNKSFDLNDIKNRLAINTYKNSFKVNNITINDKQKTIKKVNIKSTLNLNNKQSKTNIKAKNIDLVVNKISHTNNELKIVSSTLNKPFVSIILGKQKVKKEDSKKDATKTTTTKAEQKAKNDFSFDIGPFKIKNAQMVFQDKNLPIPFKTTISSLHGDFSRLHSSSSKPTKLQLEGKVDKYGYTKITGTVDINDIKLLTDTTILFKNIAIKNFTPYSGKFVGREIESGKLNLDLKYNIRKSNLDASNSIIISDIKLGKTVQSEDAASLPLDLAIALLENSDGVIDLELPITGNVDDPQFAIAPIVWKVFTNLIVKAISSPFTLLASIFGLEADDIKTIDFEYGKANIIASEKEALDNIAKILSKKKRLAIDVTPSYHQVHDTVAIQNKKFDIFLEKRMKKIVEGDEYKEALEELYKESFKDKELDDVQDKFSKEENKEYVEFLRQELASLQKVSTKELETLAKNRSENVLNYLTKEKKIDISAIIISDKVNVQIDEKDKWVSFQLNVDVKK